MTRRSELCSGPVSWGAKTERASTSEGSPLLGRPRPREKGGGPQLSTSPLRLRTYPPLLDSQWAQALTEQIRDSRKERI